MDLKKSLVDGAAALNGAWVSGIDGFGDAELLIRALDSPAAQMKMTQIYKAVYGRTTPAVIDPQVRDYALARALVEDCLIDWRNIETDGKPQPFDRAFIAGLLFVDAPANFPFATPDRKAFNEDAKIIYEALIEAANRNRAKAREDHAPQKKR